MACHLKKDTSTEEIEEGEGITGEGKQ